MSNLSRLEAVSDALDTAISTANSLPEAGGGGSVETCTVTLTSPKRKSAELIYVGLSDGIMVTSSTLTDMITGTTTVENVVCGTPIAFRNIVGGTLDMTGLSIATDGGISIDRIVSGYDTSYAAGNPIFCILFHVENEGDSSRTITIS